ncbi:MAG: Hint domain-containing protein [Rhodobacteraceae bacterium]|nr:Hint domain-containing protein [Paracoccaceae bacterium]
MRWYGLSEGATGAGVMCGLPLPPVLARGGLVLEVALAGGGPGPATLLHHARASGWAGGLRLALRGDGALLLRHSQGDRESTLVLPGAVGAGAERLRIAYGWDAPAGRARLRAEGLGAAGASPQGGAGAARETTGVAPLPLLAEDAAAIVAAAGGAERHPGTLWLGLADALPDPGRPAGIDALTAVLTPGGLRPAGTLRAGEMVLTAAGPAPLTAVTRAEVPMLGALAPVRLRGPFFGLAADLVLAPGQRLALAGAEAEYLFGAEEVLVEARHLADGQRGLRDRRPATIAIVRLGLARPGMILASGLALEAAAPGPAPLPVLRPHEAVALLAMREPGRQRRAG